MSRKEKLLIRLCGSPKDFSWDETCTLMRQCGYELRKGTGSRRAFIHPDGRPKVFMHEPHPDSILKPYAVKQLIDDLRDAGEIE